MNAVDPAIFRINEDDRSQAWDDAINAAHTLEQMINVSSLLSHEFSKAARRGKATHPMWRDAFALLHSRRDALLADLAKAEAEAKALPDAFGFSGLGA